MNDNSFDADYASAIAYSKKALDYNDKNFFALNNLAVCYFQELKHEHQISISDILELKYLHHHLVYIKVHLPRFC